MYAYVWICLLMSLLFTRLSKFFISNNIISKEQIGFMKGHHTTDHMFVLKTLIDKYVERNSKQLYTNCNPPVIRRVRCWTRFVQRGNITYGPYLWVYHRRDYFPRDNSYDQSSKLFKQNQQWDFYCSRRFSSKYCLGFWIQLTGTRVF
jgi:hypothetical protein